MAFVTAEWLTALGTYPVAETWVLTNDSGAWQLVLDVEPPSLPRETFIAGADLEVYLDLPLTTLDETALNRGTLDRALLSVSPVNVVYLPEVPIGFEPEPYDAGRIEGRFEGLISVLGAVTNRAASPAHVTITAILRDVEGVRVAETNVMDVMLHQLWPMETTPFRVDFAGADAADILDIDAIASVELIVRGVPTAHNLDRSLVLSSADTLYNAGLQPVDIPHLITLHQDDEGGVYWVDHVYLEQAIAPDDTLRFELPETPADLRTLALPVEISGPRLVDWQAEALPEIVVHGYSRSTTTR